MTRIKILIDAPPYFLPYAINSYAFSSSQWIQVSRCYNYLKLDSAIDLVISKASRKLWSLQGLLYSALLKRRYTHNYAHN